MPKPPNNWPSNALPRRLTREWASFYCGVSPNTFDGKVEAGEFPKPDHDGKYDRKLLDEAIDRINGITAPSPANESWAVRPRTRRRAGAA
ncbi:hypothetical protein [Telmatospirillum sp. J64-1]|uniref:hypothetical protein n=1 Tax=Telmatospirillum sp. J64-1 TaxID=2502183 RepID=UPI00115CF91C|nr:hypothetical protein [Telmatospirillum sp. J64-1]